MRMKAKVEGRDVVMARLRKLVPGAEQELAAEQLDVAHELAGRIRARAPGDGNYARTIGAGRLSEKGTAQRAPGLRGRTKDPNATGVWAGQLWHLLEFGTAARYHKSGKFVGVGPRLPHIFPTYRAMKKTIRRRMANAVNRAVRRARKGTQ